MNLMPSEPQRKGDVKASHLLRKQCLQKNGLIQIAETCNINFVTFPATCLNQWVCFWRSLTAGQVDDEKLVRVEEWTDNGPFPIHEMRSPRYPRLKARLKPVLGI